MQTLKPHPKPTPTKPPPPPQVPTLPPTFAGYATQLPRLRLGGIDYTYDCPASVSTGTCVKIGSRMACPRRGLGAFNHHDYEYTAALAQCAADTLDLSKACIDALAPPYAPPTEHMLLLQRKADKLAAKQRAAEERVAMREAVESKKAEASGLVDAVEDAAGQALEGKLMVASLGPSSGRGGRSGLRL